MKEKLNAFIQYISRTYFSYWIIWGIDLFISVLSTCFTYWWIHYNAEVSLDSGAMIRIGILAAIATTIASYLFHTYRNTIRYSQLRCLWPLICCSSFKSVCIAIAIFLWIEPFGLSANQRLMFVLFDGMLTLIALSTFRMLMVIVYETLIELMNKENMRILIYGTDDKSVALKTRLLHSSHYKVIGFYCYGTIYKHRRLAGFPIYYFTNEQDFQQLIRKRRIQGILFAHNESTRLEETRLLQYCKDNHIKTLIAPSISEADENGNFHQWVRPVKIEDLLGRPEININMSEVANEFSDKVVMVTGAAGSIGSELCRQLAHLGIRKLIMFDSAETPLHNIRLECERRFPHLDFVPVIGDVRVIERLRMVFDTYHPQIIFHAAAYKHVPLMEENPCEAVLVNVTGTRQVADMAVKYGAEKMIMVSTDKAVNPTNVMGCSKRLAEIYVQSLSYAIKEGKVKGCTKFITTRFGNVLGSNGSVIPRFKEQIENGGPVTVTHPDIIRYFMTIPEACRLVLEAGSMGNGGEIYIFDMGKPVKIVDLAKRMISLSGRTDVKIEFTGLRHGEKLYEELLNVKELTKPTYHEKIMIATVREYDYDEVKERIQKLIDVSYTYDQMKIVAAMKDIVPEFVSKNSCFEALDKKD